MSILLPLRVYHVNAQENVFQNLVIGLSQRSSADESRSRKAPWLGFLEHLPHPHHRLTPGGASCSCFAISDEGEDDNPSPSAGAGTSNRLHPAAFLKSSGATFQNTLLKNETKPQLNSVEPAAPSTWPARCDLQPRLLTVTWGQIKKLETLSVRRRIPYTIWGR